MIRSSLLFVFLFSFIGLGLFAQEKSKDVVVLEKSIKDLEAEIAILTSEVEEIKWYSWLNLLKDNGLPAGEYVEHLGMLLSFDKNTQQPSWVAHVISPEIRSGVISRTNDFRDDPLITGEGEEADYFLKELLADSTYRYDGFGYDRGHLAPSADFRWSARALSQSYFYSNMSPMDADFNREAWAEMEAILRAYVVRNGHALYVVTAPLISKENKKIDRGVHQLAIPGEFIKVAIDPIAGKAIGFKMPNKKLSQAISTFCFSVNDLESYTGMDFFSNPTNEQAEASYDLEDWFPSSASGGTEPILASSLSPGMINTSQAKLWMGSPKKVAVCGTVVSTRFSGSGNYWLNLDRKFPDTVFSIYIRKDDFVNFDSVHTEYLMNKKICVEGKVTEMFSLPSMNISKQEVVTILAD